MPVRDLHAPFADRAAELMDLGWAPVVLQIVREAGDELACSSLVFLDLA